MLHEFDKLHTQTLHVQFTTEVTDEQLMGQIQARDQDALAALYRRHTPLLRTVIARVVNNDADVEDLLQELFVEIWDRADRYEEAKGKALGWMVTMARRRAIDKVRKRQAYTRAEERLRLSTQCEADAMHPPTDEEAAHGDTAEIFRRILANLPPAQRQAVELAYYGGLSQRDIANRTGIPLGTVKTRLELAVRKMRAEILAIGDQAEWL